MKKIVAGLAFAVVCAPAGAATINSLLFNGAQLGSDSSAEVLINTTGGATTLDIGDRLLGIVTIEKLQQGSNKVALGFGSTNDELTGVFDIVVTGLTTTACTIGPNCQTGTLYNYTFAPVSQATFTSDTGVVAPAGTTIATFDDPAQNFNRGGTVATGITSATGGSNQWNFGFNSAADFWIAQAQTNNITVIGGLPQGVAGGVFNFGLDQLSGGIGPTLGPTGCVGPTGLVTVQACGNGSLTARDPASAFQSFDQSQIAINVTRVPEPGTLSLLGAVLFAFGISRRRRSDR